MLAHAAQVSLFTLVNPSGVLDTILPRLSILAVHLQASIVACVIVFAVVGLFPNAKRGSEATW